MVTMNYLPISFVVLVAIFTTAFSAGATHPSFAVMSLWGDHMVLQSTDDGGRNAVIYGTGLADGDVLALTAVPAATASDAALGRATLTGVTATRSSAGAATPPPTPPPSLARPARRSSRAKRCTTRWSW